MSLSKTAALMRGRNLEILRYGSRTPKGHRDDAVFAKCLEIGKSLETKRASLAARGWREGAGGGGGLQG